jgi:hypothetical protein
MTSREGVFATGDATTGPGTVIGAIAAGHKAAGGIQRFLGVENAGDCKCECGLNTVSLDPEGIKVKSALKLKQLDSEKRRLNLEDSSTPTMEEADKERAQVLKLRLLCGSSFRCRARFDCP